MGGYGLFPSHRFVWMCLLFWFGLFFCLHWDEESEVLDCKSMQRYVDLDRMRMGKNAVANSSFALICFEQKVAVSLIFS